VSTARWSSAVQSSVESMVLSAIRVAVAVGFTVYLL
jgi:hypothetical protein